MNDNNICLTNWNELPRICVPEYILHVLQNYHIIGIRFLYDAFAKKVLFLMLLLICLLIYLLYYCREEALY